MLFARNILDVPTYIILGGNVKEKLIKQYIDNMSINDVYSFASKNSVILNSSEANVIFNYIKNDWKTILYGNYHFVLERVKKEVSPTTARKIEELFNFYKNKYQSFL